MCPWGDRVRYTGRGFLTLISIFKEKVAWKLDKYDMKISMEQIQTLVEKKKYKQASDLAKTLNWHKVKDWPSLLLFGLQMPELLCLVII